MMKLALFVALACLAVVPATMAKNDFRNEFDHLLYQTVMEAIREGEHFLIHLQMEINDLEKTHNQEEKARIIREMETVIAKVEGAKHLLDRELQRTDLDIFEKFTFEMAQESGRILVQDLRKEEARIKNIK